MRKYFKLSFIFFIIFFFIFVCYSIATIYIHDPLQIYHKPFNRELTYSYTLREAGKAIIRDYDFDSVILGDSICENVSARVLNQMFGGKFFNLSISGANIYERSVILRYLLKNKKIKQVIFSTDELYYYLDINNYNYPAENYIFLYNDNPLDDIKIYLNNKYFFCSLLFDNRKECIGTKLDLDMPYEWETDEWQNKRFGGFDVWLKHKDNPQIRSFFEQMMSSPLEKNEDELPLEYIQGVEEFYDSYLFDFIRQYPDTKFYIFVPPVADIRMAQMQRDNLQFFKKHLLMLRLLTKKSENLPNMEFYTFDNLDEYTQIFHYKDYLHFDSAVGYYVLASMSKGKHRLTSANVESYIQQITNKANLVDYEKYLNQIIKAYETSDSNQNFE